MKKSRKPLVAAAIAVVFVSLSLTAYATDAFSVIRNVFFGGNVTVISGQTNAARVPVPDELQGLLFDGEGNPLTDLNTREKIYNADGEEVILVEDGGAQYIVIYDEDRPASIGEKGSVFYKLEEGLEYFITGIATPGYLPEGYRFDRAEFGADVTGEDHSSYFMTIYYTNGAKTFPCMLRFMNEETAFEVGVSVPPTELEINGHQAVDMGNALDIQIGDVLYTFFTNSDVDMDELVKIAESLT